VATAGGYELLRWFSPAVVASDSRDANFTIPAPLPPMFAFTTTGKRNPSLASTARDAWLMTRAFG
jgi:hypothetical protein